MDIKLKNVKNKVTNKLEEQKPRIGEVPFDSGRKMMTTLHKNGEEIIHDQFIEPELILRSTTGWPKRLN